MERIGIAASKIAKGNLLVYNACVVMIAFSFSLLIFLIVGSTILFALFLMKYVGKEIMDFDIEKSWSAVLSVSMGTLTVIMGLFNLVAISRNLRLPKHKE